ncbi:MLX-interacting protein [Patella vulgata]|uniref:MLX-interacting protein n=1 Tax=Patella vulgata TaxID=6465 RepID=UPI002180238D|nr:MLX-interacting protein [Patella vulgata]
MVPCAISKTVRKKCSQDNIADSNMNGDMFATHLTLFDEFNFDEEDSTSTEGQLPPSVLSGCMRTDDNKEQPVKVKRKCGRPRNPIPRHKRVSHINAEHRRRGKIQNCFRTLKNMVPKYGEITSGRDSKSDILFKAIDYSKKILAESEEHKTSIESLKQEIAILSTEIESYQTFLPEGNLFDDNVYTLNDRLEDYIQQRTRDNWKFWIFSFFIRPLFDSFKNSVITTTMDGFYRSVMDWSCVNLSLANLRTVMFGALRQISTDTSIMTDPNYIPHEALAQTGNIFDQNVYDLNPNLNPDPDFGLMQMCYTSL